MILTNEDLKAMLPLSSKANRQKYIDWLNYYMSVYKINTDERIAAFIANIGVESGNLIYNKEIASGAAYEGRKDLGNIQKGDGKRFKGRGLIQITGRHNYTLISEEVGEDFISNPELLETPKYAVLSACWYFKKFVIDKNKIS